MNTLYLLLAACIVLAAIGVYVAYKRYKNLKRSVYESLTDQVYLRIAVPIKNDKSPLAAEQFFQSLHGILRNADKSPDHFSFEIVAAHHGIYFIVVCKERYKKFIENQVYAQYPEAQITYIKDYTPGLTANTQGTILVSELAQQKEYYLPIKTFESFDVDPLASITSTISKLVPGYEVWIQIVCRPINNQWQEYGKEYIDKIRGRTDAEGKKIELESGQSAALTEIEKKNNKVGFQFIIRILVKGPDQHSAQQLLEDSEASFKQFQTAQFNSIGKIKIERSILKDLFLGKSLNKKLSPAQKYAKRFLDEKSKNIINIEELASLYHLPNQSVQTPNIAWARSKKLEYPINLPTKDARFFGLTDYRNIHIPFGVKHEDRRRHMYILGKTGTGKSTLLKTMIVADILEGKGCAVIDPHGDLVSDILNHIPEYRLKDVVYLNPSDLEFPIAFNMLDLKEDETMDLLADGIVAVFKKYFGNSWGPRLQYLLTNTILTLLHCQNVSLLAVMRILVDPNYRKFLLKQVKDPFLTKFWREEYENMSKNQKLLTEAISPIQNKVGRFLSSPMVRNMIGQVKSSIDLSDIMNSGKIFLVNLSQGKIGEENSSLLGGMIVTRLYTNAMQRAGIPESERKDFYLYVDEFQNFATETFVKILSEARKYGLNLIVTHQYIDQISEEIQNAIFGNVGTLTNFVVGPGDANRLAQEFTPYLEAEDLVNLERFRLAMKLTIDGSQSKPFTAISLKPDYKTFGINQKIIDYNREQYAKPRLEIEQKLNKWASQQYNSQGNLMQPQQTAQKNISTKKS
jgi:hypothetical protein